MVGRRWLPGTGELLVSGRVNGDTHQPHLLGCNRHPHGKIHHFGGCGFLKLFFRPSSQQNLLPRSLQACPLKAMMGKEVGRGSGFLLGPSNFSWGELFNFGGCNGYVFWDTLVIPSQDDEHTCVVRRVRGILKP